MDNLQHNQSTASERDLLISRIIDTDDQASRERFAALAASDASLWRDLAGAQRNHALLARSVFHEVSAADAVDLPTHVHSGMPLSAAWSAKMTRWGGWTVAAAVAFAWAGSVIRPVREAPPTINAGYTVRTADDALGAFRKLGLDSGRLVGEVPELVMVDSKPSKSGKGYEIVYIRQFVERAEVPEVFRVGTDELGNPFPLPVTRPASAGTGL